MKKPCPYCGETIRVGSESCEHCGKSLTKKKKKDQDDSGMTGKDYWERKTIPAWLMIAIVAVLLLCFVLVFLVR